MKIFKIQKILNIVIIIIICLSLNISVLNVKAGEINQISNLKTSPNHRYLVDQNNEPVFISGDSAWSLIVQLTNEDMNTYLTNRQSLGFNAVLVELIEHRFATYAPKNIYQVAPFTGKVFTTPNETYFEHADLVINTAKDKGMTVFLAPLYLGYACNDEGWCADVQNSSISDMQTWGTFVGNRYKNYTNIVWVIGGDVDPSPYPGLNDKVIAFANALKTADPNHLITFHPYRHQLSTSPSWSDNSWITLQAAYPHYLDTSTMLGLGYTYTPTMPVFNIEGFYENDTNNMTTQKLRAQAYWTVLAGGNPGYIFGNCPLWSLGYAPWYCISGTDPDWLDNLNTPGAVSMSYVASLFRSKQWYFLTPDTTHTVGISGYGIIDTNNYITTARVENGSLVMSYFPSLMTLTIDMTKLYSTVTARWYDVSNGTYTDVNGSPFPNTGTKQFTPPGNNSSGDTDWVLVLESEAPTGIEVLDFIGMYLLNGISINWKTAYEVSLIGFNIYKKEYMYEEYMKINTTLINAIDPGQMQGNSYQYFDKQIERGKSYYYLLEWVGNTGSKFFGPIYIKTPSELVWLSILQRHINIR